MNNSSSSPGSSWFPTFAPLFRWGLSLPARFPAFARFFRWLFSWRTLGRIMVGLAILATLITLVCTEEHWRGKRAWTQYKHELEVQGEKLDWKDYVPPPVPDQQNFAMTPFLAPLYDLNPERRPEGQSRWRDTNGYNRANSLRLPNSDLLADEFHQDRTARRMTDLPTWTLALAGKLSQAPAPLAPEPPPGEAAAEEAFRKRYGLRPSAETSPALEAAAAAAAALTRPEAAAQVLRALEKFNPVLEELRSASQRPYARFNIRYDDDFVPAILLPHLAILKNAALIFQLRACAELALDRTDQAWADTKMALYLAEPFKDEPFLISKMVQLAIFRLSLQPIWEGLAEHKWSDAQLVEIEQCLAKLDLLADAALRGERAASIRTIEQARNLGMLDLDSSDRLPGLFSLLLGGFFYQNQLNVTRMYQQFFVPVVDAANQRIYPARAVANGEALYKAITGGFRPYNLYPAMLVPGITAAVTKFGFGQTRVNEAIVACALERYRLAQGQFPDSLEPLCPRFLQKMPHDIITDAPLIYRRTPDGQFILYSVGWNEKDDGGQVMLTKAGQPSSNLTEGDWVWQYSAPTVSPVQKAARN